MRVRLSFVPVFCSALSAFCAENTPPASAADIMKQVAANQDREQKERSNYLYGEHIRVIIRRGGGKLAREESSDLLVTPGGKDTKRKMQSITGRYWKKGHYNSFVGEPIPKRRAWTVSWPPAFARI